MADIVNVLNLKVGMAFFRDKELYQVLSTEYSQYQQRQGTVKVKAKNLNTGSVINIAYVSGEKVESAFLERKQLSYIYDDGMNFVFMDNKTYEQVLVNKNRLSDKAKYLLPETLVWLLTYNGDVLDVELPDQVIMIVTYAEPAVKGNSVNSSGKRIVTETGLEIEAPLFINTGDKVIISTSTGKYVSRA